MARRSNDAAIVAVLLLLAAAASSSNPPPPPRRRDALPDTLPSGSASGDSTSEIAPSPVPFVDVEVPTGRSGRRRSTSTAGMPPVTPAPDVIPQGGLSPAGDIDVGTPAPIQGVDDVIYDTEGLPAAMFAGANALGNMFGAGLGSAAGALIAPELAAMSINGRVDDGRVEWVAGNSCGVRLAKTGRVTHLRCDGPIAQGDYVSVRGNSARRV